MNAYRAQLLRFDTDGTPLYESDGLLVVGLGTDGVQRVVDAGPYRTVAARHPQVAVTHWPDRLIAPGFIDMHVHYPQTDIIGAPADGLLPWLENYTFPAETRFAQPAYAAEVANVFFSELLRHGVTTALAFATTHPASVDAFFQGAQKRGLRMISGKVLQDRHSPDGLRDETEQSLIDSETLIQRWHGQGRLGYAITPRFAPTSTDAQLRGAGELAARHPDTWIHSHVAENRDEVRWVRELFPQARSYVDVYRGFGLLRERAVYAHCIHLDDADRALMRDTGAVAAVSPTSNLFLGSGFFDYEGAERIGMRHGLASDVGGGTSLSMLRTLADAYKVQALRGVRLTAWKALHAATRGAAEALGLGGEIGSLDVGRVADLALWDWASGPVARHRDAQARKVHERVFAWMTLGDERNLRAAWVAGQARFRCETAVSAAFL